MIAALILASLLQVAADPAEPLEAKAEIVVEVGPLRNLRGFLGCRLFDHAEGFPNDGTRARSQQRHVPKGNAVTCTFTGLDAGTYAIAVHHDEDGDGRLATNFLGIPTEGYGASNNKLPSMSAPNFPDSSFKLERGEKKKISITVRY
jgi:uncharacterized protein (DUF2141 family)